MIAKLLFCACHLVCNLKLRGIANLEVSLFRGSYFHIRILLHTNSKYTYLANEQFLKASINNNALPIQQVTIFILPLNT